jgi:diacylglycerol kinase
MERYLYLCSANLRQQVCVVIAALPLSFAVQRHRYDRIGLYSVMSISFS